MVFLGRALTALLVVLALGMTGLVVRQLAFERQTPVRRLTAWRKLESSGRVIGPDHAPVKLVEFSDFQCPFCAQLQETLGGVRAAYPEEVAIVYRHLPIERLHDHAIAAANAAECAAQQGMFAEYHDALYEEQWAIGRRPWSSFAEAVGVPDLGAFDACVRDSSYVETVRADLALARELGFRGAPTVIVSGYVLEAASIGELEQRVDKLVRAARRASR